MPTSVVSTYGQLPEPGLVDTLPRSAGVDLVGYGVQEQDRGGGPPVWTGLFNRFQADARLVSGNFTHSEEFVRITGNPGQVRAARASVTRGDPLSPTRGRPCSR